MVVENSDKFILHNPFLQILIFRMRYLFLLLFVSGISCNKLTNSLPEAISFTNPLLPSGPDPWVYQKDSVYYYTSTTSYSIELYKTKSISRLNSAHRKTVWVPPSTGLNRFHIWAPELHYIGNKWYLYYTAGGTENTASQRIFVLENDSPDPMEGEWKDLGKVTDKTKDFYAIDATIFELHDKLYIVYSGVAEPGGLDRNLYIALLNTPSTFGSPRKLIATPTYKWEKVGAPINEGPQIIKNVLGRVFMVYSASACWSENYALGMLSLAPGTDPLEPDSWTKYDEPIFKSKKSSKAFGPGHNSFFKSPSGKEDWIIYHANEEASQGCSNFRSPRIQKISWNSDGTPHLGEPAPINYRILRPDGEKD